MSEADQELARNTPEQIAAIRRAEELWAREQTWPRWQVELTGDEVEYTARGGVNMDDDGVPQPYTDTARCSVILRAPNEEYARAQALRANMDAGYHTVESAQELSD